jgi:hypothetical protein
MKEQIPLNDEQDQDYALLLANIRDTLRTPQGYAVILYLLKESLLFEFCATPVDSRELFDMFFRDIENADPSTALRLFAHCRQIKTT